MGLEFFSRTNLRQCYFNVFSVKTTSDIPLCVFLQSYFAPDLSWGMEDDEASFADQELLELPDLSHRSSFQKSTSYQDLFNLDLMDGDDSWMI